MDGVNSFVRTRMTGKDEGRFIVTVFIMIETGAGSTCNETHHRLLILQYTSTFI